MNRLQRVPMLPVVAALTCTALWADHPRTFDQALAPLIRKGDIREANRAFLKVSQTEGRNQLLYLYELASLQQLKGDVETSRLLLDQADAVAHREEGRAVASVSGGATQLGAGLSNDSLLTWEGAAFDKVMARTLNALNYLAQNSLEGAKVEVKKAEEYQRQERRRIEARVERAGSTDLAADRLSSAYGPMFSLVKNVRNSYENAFTYYLSSQIYRSEGSDGFNDALVDIRQAYALAPEAPVIQAAYLDLVARTAQGPDGEAELTALKKRFGVGGDWRPTDPATTGTVVVVFVAGLVPKLSEVSVNLPLPSDEWFSMAFPIYQDLGTTQPPLRIQTGDVQFRTSRVLDVRLLAVKHLKERMPAILGRGALGAVGKIQAQKKAEQEFGFFGKLAAQVATRAVTRADLRSWLGLPSEVQVAQFALAPGASDLTLACYDWSGQVQVNVAPGATTFVTVRGIPGYKAIFATTLGPTGLSSGEVPVAGGAGPN